MVEFRQLSLRRSVQVVLLAALVFAASFQALSIEGPALLAPYPWHSFFLALWFRSQVAAAGLMTGLFLASALLVSFRPNVMHSLGVIIGALTAATLGYFLVMGREGAMRYGISYVTALGSMNAVALVILGLRWRASRHRPDEALLLIFGLWLLLSWCAFPYFGEGL